MWRGRGRGRARGRGGESNTRYSGTSDPAHRFSTVGGGGEGMRGGRGGEGRGADQWTGQTGVTTDRTLITAARTARLQAEMKGLSAHGASGAGDARSRIPGRTPMGGGGAGKVTGNIRVGRTLNPARMSLSVSTVGHF